MSKGTAGTEREEGKEGMRGSPCFGGVVHAMLCMCVCGEKVVDGDCPQI